MCVKSERQAAGWIQSSSLNFMARVKATKDMGPQKHVDGWLHIPSSFQLSSEHIHGRQTNTRKRKHTSVQTTHPSDLHSPSPLDWQRTAAKCIKTYFRFITEYLIALYRCILKRISICIPQKDHISVLGYFTQDTKLLHKYTNFSEF